MLLLLQLQIVQKIAHGNSDTATKLQTTRNIIINGAVKGSASFDGSKDITIKATQENIAVVAGNITLSNGTGEVELSYPSSYNANNTVLLSVAINFANGYAIGQYASFAEFYAMLKSNSIKVSCSNASSSSGPSKTCPVKVVLMKI